MKKLKAKADNNAKKEFLDRVSGNTARNTMDPKTVENEYRRPPNPKEFNFPPCRCSITGQKGNQLSLKSDQTVVKELNLLKKVLGDPIFGILFSFYHIRKWKQYTVPYFFYNHPKYIFPML